VKTRQTNLHTPSVTNLAFGLGSSVNATLLVHNQVAALWLAHAVEANAVLGLCKQHPCSVGRVAEARVKEAVCAEPPHASRSNVANARDVSSHVYAAA